jgi:phosphoglycolate phosphatase-like HAD superfamily hydrolase
MISFTLGNATGSLIFDSDGTVLNSLGIKRSISSEVFRELGFNDWASIGSEFANMSGSRASKIKILEQTHGLPIDSARFDELFTDCLLQKASEIEIREGLQEFRERSLSNCWYLLTNGSQDETRKLYKRLGIDQLFDGGIWGSPFDKSAHIDRLKFGRGDLMISDSREDYLLSQKFRIPFAYLAGWNTENDAAYFDAAGITPHFSL